MAVADQTTAAANPGGSLACSGPSYRDAGSLVLAKTSCCLRHVIGADAIDHRGKFGIELVNRIR